ncbi:prephenate dehydrogenase [Chloroflexota bacterium]
MKVAIIGGSGKMGRWFADFLVKDGKQITLIGRNEKKLLEAREQLGVEVSTSIEAIKDTDAVLISVPIDNFEEVVKQLQPHLSPKQVVIDITSIKALPVEVMHKHIKTGVVLGAHPVFGPGAKDIQNRNFVLTPTSSEETALAEKIKQYIEARGARVAMMTPHEHDEMMAVILGLAHFIAIVSAETLVTFDTLKQMRQISGTTYRVLLTLVESVISENPEFYASLQMNLPRITEIEELFQQSSKTWAEIVKNKDGQAFANRMTTLKKEMEKHDADFGKAYENMYKLWTK